MSAALVDFSFPDIVHADKPFALHVQFPPEEQADFDVALVLRVDDDASTDVVLQVETVINGGTLDVEVVIDAPAAAECLSSSPPRPTTSLSTEPPPKWSLVLQGGGYDVAKKIPQLLGLLSGSAVTQDGVAPSDSQQDTVTYLSTLHPRMGATKLQVALRDARADLWRCTRAATSDPLVASEKMTFPVLRAAIKALVQIAAALKENEDLMLEAVALLQDALTNPAGAPQYRCAACRGSIDVASSEGRVLRSSPRAAVFHASCLPCHACSRLLSEGESVVTSVAGAVVVHLGCASGSGDQVPTVVDIFTPLPHDHQGSLSVATIVADLRDDLMKLGEVFRESTSGYVRDRCNKLVRQATATWESAGFQTSPAFHTICESFCSSR